MHGYSKCFDNKDKGRLLGGRWLDGEGSYLYAERDKHERASGREMIDVPASICRQVNGVIVEVISVFSR